MPNTTSPDFWKKVYLVTPETVPTSELIGLCKFYVQKQIPFLQFRNNQISDNDYVKLANQIGTLCQGTKTKFIVNNRYWLLDQITCDGLHVGQKDLPSDRAFLPKKLILGISVSNYTHAQRALTLRPDYFGFGAIYFTPTKPEANIANLQDLLAIQKLQIPLVAIGGINFATIKKIEKFHFDYYAMVAGLWNHYLSANQD